MTGWVKLHRSIMQPDSTFGCLTAIQKMIAVYLIANASHKDCLWKDAIKGDLVPIKRGQLVVSVRGITEWFLPGEVTNQITRTCMKKLEKLNFLTQKATNRYTVITLLNYEVYQDLGVEANTESNKWVTNEHPKPNKPSNNIQEGIKNLKKKSIRRNQPVYDEQSLEFRSAKYLYDNILQFKPDLKKPNLQSWANDMRLLMDLDKKDKKEVKSVIEWVTKDSFWQVNILSAKSLRKQWDKVTAKMNQVPFKPSNKSQASHPVQAMDETERNVLMDAVRKQAERNGKIQRANN